MKHATKLFLLSSLALGCSSSVPTPVEDGGAPDAGVPDTGSSNQDSGGGTDAADGGGGDAAGDTGTQCTPRTCADLDAGAVCATYSDGCGSVLQCGDCDAAA